MHTKGVRPEEVVTFNLHLALLRLCAIWTIYELSILIALSYSTNMNPRNSTLLGIEFKSFYVFLIILILRPFNDKLVVKNRQDGKLC